MRFLGHSSITSLLLLCLPASLTAQNLYLSGGSGGDLYRFAPDGTRTTITSGLLYSGLACDNLGNLYAASAAPAGNSIFRFAPDGNRSTFASGLNEPNGLAFNSAGDLFEADFGSKTIYQFTPAGVRSTFASLPNYPYGLAFDHAGNLFASTYRGSSLYKFTPGGGFTSFGSGLSNPFDVACDALGNVFVADLGGGSINDGSIYKFAPDGTRTTFASGLDPIGLAFDNSGDLFAADYGSDTVYKYAADGTRSIFAQGVVGHGVFWLAFQVPEPSVGAILGTGALVLLLRYRPDSKRSPKITGNDLLSLYAKPEEFLGRGR